jgi:hypothetical protein
MATYEELADALRNADKAGDVEAARALADALANYQQPMQSGTKNNNLAAQAGLTARSALKGVAGIPQLFTEPLRYVTDRAYEAVTGRKSPSVPLTMLADQASDAAGLPTPDTPTQRIVAKGVELGTGAAGLAGAVGRASNAGGELVKSGAQQVLARMATDPAMQIASGTGAGLAGQHAAENGAGAFGQFASSLAGGLGGAGLLGATRAGASKLGSLMQGPQLTQQRIDQRINVTLQSQGIDPATITPAMRSALRDQVGKAMKIGGDLDEAAVARLADYTRLGMTPTRARLTLDPYDVTQEANAAKLAAATGARDAKLPQIAQANNQRLVGLIDDMGGARPVDPYGQGVAVRDAIRARDEQLRTGVDTLYQRARDTSGRSLPLDGVAWTQRANQALDEAMVGGALPADVANTMNRVARGEMPFTVEIAEQIKTRLATLQRSTNDGTVRHALGIVRQTLDDTPLIPARQVNPGNLPAVPGTVPPSPTQIGQESIDAFNAARQAARGRFAWQESSPVIGRALDDSVNADTFVQQNILSKAAGFDSVAKAANVINSDPVARESVRTAIVQHLKDSAIGKGGTSETGNFSGRGMTAALKDIGDRKLGLFFDGEEIETLKAMARTGSFEVFQPRGSAVNNSNSAAGIGSLLQSISQRLKPVADKVPFGKQAISEPLDSLTYWAMQKPALDVPRGLLVTPQQQGGRIDPLLLPALYGGGLLAAPGQ